jgi:hypothetical protein
MVKKTKINEKLIINYAIVALIACTLVWVRFQGMNMIMEIQDLMSRNNMSALEFMMRLSLFH